MSSKLKGVRLEQEVEKCRSEQHWERLNDLLVVICQKGSGMESVTNFLNGEALVELYIDRFAPEFPKPGHQHKEDLREAKKYLHSAIEKEEGVGPSKGIAVHMEGNLLLAKLHYICGKFEECLSDVDKSRLDKYENEFKTLRTLRLAVEGYALRALCYELDPPRLKTKYQRDAYVLTNFEQSSSLALRYLDMLDKELSSNLNSTTNNSLSSAPSLSQPGSTAMLLMPPGSSGTSGATPTTPGMGLGGTLMSSKGMVSQDRLGYLMETALQRAPILKMKKNLALARVKDGEESEQNRELTLKEGIRYYRNHLIPIDKRVSRGVQQVLARQLAEYILRGVSDSAYPGSEYEVALGIKPQFHIGFHPDDPSSPTSHPAVPFPPPLTKQAPSTMFDPKNRIEDAVVLLFISDNIICREAVLSTAPEHSEQYQSSLDSVKAVQNLISLVLGTLKQYPLLLEVFERSLKFAYEDVFMWSQCALCLLCHARFSRSALFIEECLKLRPRDAFFHIFAARMYIEHLGCYQEGIELTDSAIELEQGGWLTARALIVKGLGHSLVAQTLFSYSDRKWEESKALDCFHRAVRHDDKDHIAWFFLSLQYAIKRKMEDAKECIQKALELNPDHAASVLLLALLLTAEKSLPEALSLVEDALENNPNHLGLVVLRMKCELQLGRNDDALLSAKDLLVFWKRDSVLRADQHNGLNGYEQADGGGTSVKGASPLQFSEERPVSQNTLPRNSSTAGGGTPAPITPAYGGPNTLSIVPSSPTMTDITDRESIAASFHGNAVSMSEFGAAASTLSESLAYSANVQRNQLQVFRTQANIWLELGELFLDEKRFSEMESCVEEALQLFPSCHQAFYLRGRAHQASGRLNDAKQSYLSALSTYACHIPSLRYLALVYREENKFCMAEKTLRDVVRTDPLDVKAWNALGMVLSDMGHFVESIDCFETAALLEESNPLLPYSVIPRILHLA